MASAIAHAQSAVVNRHLRDLEPHTAIADESLKAVLQEMLLLTDQNTGQPFVSAVSLEFANGESMGAAGSKVCRNCFITDVPLYDGSSGELFALMRVHSDPSFDEALRTDARRGLLGWLIGVLLLTLIGWRIVLLYQTRVRETEHYAQAVFDSSPLPLVLVNADDFSIESVNRAATELLGEIDQLPPELQQLTLGIADVGEGLGLNDAYIETANGTRTPVLVNFSPLRVGGRGSLVVSLVDISERKRFEQQLYEARDRAESASRAKGAFLAAMSHEVRTPLHGIMGFTDLLSRSCKNQAQQEYLELIRVSASNLLEVIEEILDFSRIEAGKIEVTREPFDLLAEIEGTVRLFQPKANSKGFELALSLGDGLPQSFNSDAKRVRQIITILIDNAIKFTERGGVQVVAQFSAGRVRVTVIDTGIGIAEEHFEHLFEPFYQVEQGASRGYGGTGLGLVIARNFARRLGGDITVESEPGAGSRFTLLLPLRD